MSIRICNPKYFIMYLCVGLEILILNTIGLQIRLNVEPTAMNIRICNPK